MTKTEAQTLLDAAKELVIVGLIVHQEPCYKAQAPTGEYFIEIVSGKTVEDQVNRQGFISDADKYKIPVYPTAEAAVAAWKEQFLAYVGGFDFAKGGEPYVLYWRVPPNIEIFKGEWKVYSRCLISNKPVLLPPPGTAATQSATS